MMRVDDAVFELKKIRNVYANMRKEYKSCVEALDTAIKALETQKWIPCSEGLPEEGKAVLAWCPTFKNSYCVYRKNDAWWIFGAYRTALQEIVVAWMPVPEPYKEEE